MPNPTGPTDKDIVTMVVSTVNHWRQQRAMHAQKVAEYDALLRKIGVETDPSVLEEIPKIAEMLGENSLNGIKSSGAEPPSSQGPGGNRPKIKISPFISSSDSSRHENTGQKNSPTATKPA